MNDISLSCAAREILADLKRLRFFGWLLFAAILLAAWGTHTRNFAWQTSGSLWCDILKKVNATKIIDPLTGNEVPRFKRGRIYNNLGLSLFRKGREILIDRENLRKLQTRVTWLKSHPQKKSSSEVSSPGSLKNLQAAIRTYEETLLRTKAELSRNVPAEFAAALPTAASGDDWDPLRPAELCYERSLYHRPNWFISSSNYALIFKLRRQLLPRDTPQWLTCLLREEGELRQAVSFFQDDPKTLRYFGESLLELGEYWLRQKEPHNKAKCLGYFREADTVCRRAFELILRGAPDVDSALENCRKQIIGAASGRSHYYESVGDYEKAANLLEEHLSKLLPSESPSMQKRIDRLRQCAAAKKKTSPRSSKHKE